MTATALPTVFAQIHRPSRTKDVRGKRNNTITSVGRIAVVSWVQYITMGGTEAAFGRVNSMIRWLSREAGGTEIFHSCCLLAWQMPGGQRPAGKRFACRGLDGDWLRPPAKQLPNQKTDHWRMVSRIGAGKFAVFCKDLRTVLAGYVGTLHVLDKGRRSQGSMPHLFRHACDLQHKATKGGVLWTRTVLFPLEQYDHRRPTTRPSTLSAVVCKDSWMSVGPCYHLPPSRCQKRIAISQRPAPLKGLRAPMDLRQKGGTSMDVQCVPFQ